MFALKKRNGEVTQQIKLFSLNYKLIFLPPTLVKYIVLHELCHARYIDHSPEFWKELEKFDKNWKKNRAALDEADEFIPSWVILF